MIINYYIIYKKLNYFAHANAFKSKIYKYSQAETCRLAVFCVKLTFCSDFMVPWPRKLSSRSAHLFCEFSSLEECKRFYNILYAYVCKIYEEKFGGCWWSFSWLGQSVSVTVLGNESTETLFQFCSIQRLTKKTSY